MSLKNTSLTTYQLSNIESESFSSVKTMKAGNIVWWHTCAQTMLFTQMNIFPIVISVELPIIMSEIITCFPLNTVHYTSPSQMFRWRSWSTPVLNKVLKIQVVDDKWIPQLLISHSLIQRESFKNQTINNEQIYGVTLLMCKEIITRGMNIFLAMFLLSIW